MSRLPENPISDQAHPAGPLFDGPGPGSLPPVADADLACVLDEIHQCSGYANQVRAFILMSWLMRGRTSVPAQACPLLIKVFRSAVADLPMPLVDDTVVNHRFILDRLLEHRAVRDDTRLLSNARTAAYRLCEAINDFDRAKAILVEMIASADEQEDPVREARLSNNYAYEFLLEGDYRAALQLDEKLTKGPGWLWRFLRNVPEAPPTIRDRAEYLEAELAKPAAERLLQVPEKDAEQRMYKVD